MIVLERELRSRRWTFAELARRSGLNQVTVGQIVSRRFRPYPSQLAKIATALDWPLKDAGALLEEVTVDGE
ncbi:MAG TPA: XRE family transcriptional regulator [Coriobacteriia bacterium]|nr:MAG: hypothetical protein XD74_0860 [Actinobacteria bacterium 66_15]HAL29403.1 XRE family transcriptional regulator [Coriobacteriia bacterium]